MRVIAGSFRSRQLVAPRGSATRPTSDRLRETAFNILSSRIAESHFVDLYAGTGAVGIEAISRGAAHVWFAENAEPALVALRANLATLKIARGFTLDDRGTGAMLQRLARSTQRIDVVYLDPPYEADDEYSGTLNFFGSVRGRPILADGAVLVAEHSSKAPLASRYGLLERTRTVKQGDAALSFFAVAAGTKAGPDPQLGE